VGEIDIFNQQAAQLLQSGKAAEAFDLTKEPDKVRERYGRHSWGQSHLLARRLIESGTRFVTTVNGPSITWDTHKDNFNGLKSRLVPPMEQAYAALHGRCPTERLASWRWRAGAIDLRAARCLWGEGASRYQRAVGAAAGAA
jgi:hypothetical protein